MERVVPGGIGVQSDELAIEIVDLEEVSGKHGMEKFDKSHQDMELAHNPHSDEKRSEILECNDCEMGPSSNHIE